MFIHNLAHKTVYSSWWPTAPAWQKTANRTVHYWSGMADTEQHSLNESKWETQTHKNCLK